MRPGHAMVCPYGFHMVGARLIAPLQIPFQEFRVRIRRGESGLGEGSQFPIFHNA